ncbi:hypothetical protein D3C80_1481190 [compost metagenome]
MSRKDDRIPVIQKYMALIGAPSGEVTSATSGANAPFSAAFNMAMTGMMVMKIAANSLPTSSIGPHSKPFSLRRLSGVRMSEAIAAAIRMRSRTIFCTSQCRPKTGTEISGFHEPDISTAPITTASNAKLILPEIPIFGVSGVGSETPRKSVSPL